MSKIYIATKSDLQSLGGNIAPIVQSDIDAAYTAAANKGATLPAAASRTLANLPSVLATIPGDRIGDYISCGATSISSDAPTVGQYKFYRDTNIQTVSLSECTSIGDYAFSYDTALTTVYAPKVTYVGTWAFCDNSNLSSLTMPELTSVASGVFQFSNKLVSVSFPKLQRLSSDLFKENYLLQRLNLDTLYSCNVDPFSSCRALNLIEIKQRSSTFVMSCGILSKSNVTQCHVWCSDGYLTYDSSTSSWTLNAYPDPSHDDSPTA